MGHVGVGGHAGVGWVMQGWVGHALWVMQGLGGLGHVGVRWGGPCRDGVGWVM